MSEFKGLVYASQDQLDEIEENGSLTVGEETKQLDGDRLYLVEDDSFVVITIEDFYKVTDTQIKEIAKCVSEGRNVKLSYSGVNLFVDITMALCSPPFYEIEILWQGVNYDYLISAEPTGNIVTPTERRIKKYYEHKMSLNGSDFILTVKLLSDRSLPFTLGTLPYERLVYVPAVYNERGTINPVSLYMSSNTSGSIRNDSGSISKSITLLSITYGANDIVEL